jgi:hypothetical protein
MIPARVDPRESMQKTGRGWVGAGSCKQSIRGAVGLYHTCPDVPLTGVVGGRSQTAHHSHLSSHVSVGLVAAVTVTASARLPPPPVQRSFFVPETQRKTVSGGCLGELGGRIETMATN